MTIKTHIARIIEAITFRRVRFNHNISHLMGNPDNVDSLRWFWTPWTRRFDHGGWIFVSLSWFIRFRRGVKSANEQDIKARLALSKKAVES